MHTRRDEDGFMLIELLVVVIIVGILAAIAIPTFLTQREKAWARTVQSDLRNAAVMAESYFNDNLTYIGLDPTVFRVSDGDAITIRDADHTGYCIEADHSNLPGAPDYHFSLALGRPVSGPCVP